MALAIWHMKNPSSASVCFTISAAKNPSNASPKIPAMFHPWGPPRVAKANGAQASRNEATALAPLIMKLAKMLSPEDSSSAQPKARERRQSRRRLFQSHGREA